MISGKSRARQHKKLRSVARMRAFERWSVDHDYALTYRQWQHEHMRRRAILARV